MQTLLNADATHIPVADRYFHACITSPPYYGLRTYTGVEPTEWPAVTYAPMAGLEPVTVPGCKDGCEHEWADGPAKTYSGGTEHALTGQHKDQHTHFETTQGQWCRLCGGWRGCLGLEPTPEMYVAHLVLIFREVHRVLRDDGTCFLVLGDSYAGSNCGSNDHREHTGLGARPSDRYHGQKPGLPTSLKPKDLCGIPWRVTFALQADGWYLRSDVIWAKCLSGGAILYARTQKGEMPATLKDLVRLDPKTVQLWDGAKWNQVVEWGDVLGDPNRKRKSATRRAAKHRGVELAVEGDIELEFRNGERVGCTREHKWPTQRGTVLACDLQVGDVVPTVTLPEPPLPAQPAALDDEDTGWFVGMYLAEGSRSGDTLQFAGHVKEHERHARLKRIAEAYHGTCAVHQTTENGSTANINGPILVALVDTYISGRTCKGKHLGPRCWTRSNAFLCSLLQGYLEGDGHHRANGWRIGFAANDALAADLRTLAARLGYSLRLRRAVAINTSTGKQHKMWRGDVVFDPMQRRSPDGEIVAIRQSRARKFHSVTLAEAPHTFALASGICTQNSNPMPESVRDRPTKAHEYVFVLTKSQRYFWDQEAVREPLAASTLADRRNGTGRHTQGKVASKYYDEQSPDAATPDMPSWYRTKTFVNSENGRNIRTVWSIPTAPYKGAHFACYPPALVTPMVRASTSERGCCPKCGKAWVRVVEKVTHFESGSGKAGRTPDEVGGKWGNARHGQNILLGPVVDSATLGFRPACTCYGTAPWPSLPRKERGETDEAYRQRTAPIRSRQERLMQVYEQLPTVPCRVLDPFIGSGTTLLVARQEGCDGVGLDMSYTYLRDQARVRLGLDALDTWENGIKTDNSKIDDLPLFNLP